MTDLELAKVIDAARDEVVVQRNAALAEVARLTRDVAEVRLRSAENVTALNHAMLTQTNTRNERDAAVARAEAAEAERDTLRTQLNAGKP